MNQLRISAIICTHNRDSYLGAAIDSLLQQDWFWRRSWWQGVSECYREEVAGKRRGVTRFRRAGKALLQGLYKGGKYFADPKQRFENLLYAYGQMGYLTAAVKNKGSGIEGVIFAPSTLMVPFAKSLHLQDYQNKMFRAKAQRLEGEDLLIKVEFCFNGFFDVLGATETMLLSRKRDINHI